MLGEHCQIGLLTVKGFQNLNWVRQSSVNLDVSGLSWNWVHVREPERKPGKQQRFDALCQKTGAPVQIVQRVGHLNPLEPPDGACVLEDIDHEIVIEKWSQAVRATIFGLEKRSVEPDAWVQQGPIQVLRVWLRLQVMKHALSRKGMVTSPKALAHTLAEPWRPVGITEEDIESLEADIQALLKGLAKENWVIPKGSDWVAQRALKKTRLKVFAS